VKHLVKVDVLLGKRQREAIKTVHAAYESLGIPCWGLWVSQATQGSASTPYGTARPSASVVSGRMFHEDHFKLDLQRIRKPIPATKTTIATAART
jgi:hypothetical protein